MSVHIDSSSRLINSQEKSLALTCPHCQVVAHISVAAVPRFEDLQTHRPAQVGIVYRCDACNAPVFLRFAVRMYAANRIELSPQFTEVERAREKFSFTYLPEEVELLFREALTCYSSGAFNAFASMCRRSAQAVFADLGELRRELDAACGIHAHAEAQENRRLAGIASVDDADLRWAIGLQLLETGDRADADVRHHLTMRARQRQGLLLAVDQTAR